MSSSNTSNMRDNAIQGTIVGGCCGCVTGIGLAVTTLAGVSLLSLIGGSFLLARLKQIPNPNYTLWIKLTGAACITTFGLGTVGMVAIPILNAGGCALLGAGCGAIGMCEAENGYTITSPA